MARTSMGKICPFCAVVVIRKCAFCKRLGIMVTNPKKVLKDQDQLKELQKSYKKIPCRDCLDSDRHECAKKGMVQLSGISFGDIEPCLCECHDEEESEE